MENIEKCLDINIKALKDAGYIRSKENLSEEELKKLREVIEHAKKRSFK